MASTSSYIDALQRRLTKAEQILAVACRFRLLLRLRTDTFCGKLAPHIDLSKELDDSNDITYILSNLRRDQPGQLQPRPPSPPKQVPRPLHSSVNPSQVVAAFTEWRDNDSSDSDADGFTFLPLHPPPDGIIHGQQYSSLPHRFHGKSSGVVLVQKVMGMKRDHTGSSASPEDSTKQLLVKPHPVSSLSLNKASACLLVLIHSGRKRLRIRYRQNLLNSLPWTCSSILSKCSSSVSIVSSRYFTGRASRRLCAMEFIHAMQPSVQWYYYYVPLPRVGLPTNAFFSNNRQMQKIN